MSDDINRYLKSSRDTLYDLTVNSEHNMWRHPPGTLSLSDTEVHLWKIRTSEYDTGAELFYRGLLSWDEKERAERIRPPGERKRYVITRGILRTLLSGYLREAPEDISIEYNEHGKPGVAVKLNPLNIKFNLSHSRDLVLYAVAKNREIGIDVEFMRDVSKAGGIIERFFSAAQREFYGSQTGDMKKLAFFRLWTEREAYGKALGRGFSVPAGDCGIPLIRNDRDPAVLVTGRSLSGKWSIYDLEPEDNFTAALAVEGKRHDIKLFIPSLEDNMAGAP